MSHLLSTVILFLAISVNLFSQESDLFCHKRINLYDIENMPNANGTDHRDSILNNRIWRVEQPRMYVYTPGLEERCGAAVIVIPGGGYVKQAYETVGVSFAKWLNTFGVTAFVLIHRLPNQPDLEEPSIAPVMDAQRAVKWIRSHAADYGVSPHKIGLIGCSAGAHISACVNVAKEDYSRCGDALDTVSCRPDFAILVSPAGKIDGVGESPKNTKGDIRKLMERFPINTMIDGDTSPMLMFHASDDRTVSPLNSVEIYKSLLLSGVSKSSLHIFPFGAHGIALRGQPGSTACWTHIAEAWMREIDMIK
ncbi:alpha/beta hydrolase [Xylanibacter muris]|uniref:Alpha/beta hydrolase n=1 Tax=Xylanibacter muris TaxID=2736290 RepID=A0ABX2AQW7_9BACT|nr:alpha/beta hydrolase [Xylanibacter muris]NPD92437.1 alpha/beta hydrolase [Xylanibacter muris]